MAGKSKFPIGTAIAIVGIGAVAYKGLSFLDTASNIKMEFAGLAPKGISGGKLKLGVTFRFLNPTGNDVNLEYVLANIKLGNDLIGEISESNFKALRASRPDAFKLKSKSASTIPLTISMPVSNAILQVLEILVDSKTERTVSVDGFWKAEGVVRQSFNISEKVQF